MNSKFFAVIGTLTLIASLAIGQFSYVKAQDDGGGYYGNIEVERMASRIDRYIKTHGTFMFTLQTLLSQQSRLTDIELDNAGIGRYTYIDSLSYFDTTNGNIITRDSE
jgi:hypothetical protein|tara:strand:+ start:130 stop:453 length:324 start_codon:yes stop_codon:yes gene_type:complete